MHIKAVCKMHKDSDVLFLEGTVSFRNKDGGVQGDDSLENVTEMVVDEANLYCTFGTDSEDHDIEFVVQPNVHWDGHQV